MNLPRGPRFRDLQPTRRIAYLFSRYPVISHTFCDSEMLGLEARGVELTIGSLNPPANRFRHECNAQFRAETVYPPPSPVLAAIEKQANRTGEWPSAMVERHEHAYGNSFKAATRARNAAFFASEFRKRGVEHIHVHFANRATHTALFIKEIAGIPFSFTAHAQDFMVDLGDDNLLREMCREAQFVVAVSDWSRDLLARTCPDSDAKITRIYNGVRLEDFTTARAASTGPLKMISIGRLIEFKGFHHLLVACAKLKERGVPFELAIVGTGPWSELLLARRAELGLENEVDFLGNQTQEQVKARLADSHVFVLPCIVDSKGASDILPTVIMEAMAAALPVVSTHLVGVPEMVEDGKTGLLVQPGDEGPLADALENLANDPELRAKLGAAGRSLAETRFQREVAAGQLLEKFGPAPEKRPTPGRGGESLLYLVERWPCGDDPKLAGELDYAAAHRLKIAFLACSAGPGQRFDKLPFFLPAQLEFLPDGMVLEADWHADPDAVKSIVDWRNELGSVISTERYFLEARRALRVALILRKRGIEHVHAARSTGAITAWITWKLGSAKRFSFAIEDGAELDRTTLDTLEKDACAASRPDKDDALQLAKPEPRRLKLGPLKVRLGGPANPDRTPLYEAWFQRLTNPPSSVVTPNSTR